jgi:hypothetical protein
MAKSKPPCPKCGSTDSIPFAYGYPERQLFEAAQRGEVAVGGRALQHDKDGRVISPAWKCKACGTPHGRFEVVEATPISEPSGSERVVGDPDDLEPRPGVKKAAKKAHPIRTAKKKRATK